MRFGSLMGELHRRSVWQVLGGYAVVAWIILQLEEMLEGLIGLPLWFGPAAVVVVLLGFPVLLVTALTQGGRKKDDDHSALFHDSAEGSDASLSSWRRLDGGPFRNAMDRVFTWPNALAGAGLMAVLLVVGSAGYSGLRMAGIGPMGSLVAKGVFEPNESLVLSEFEDLTVDGTLGETVTDLFRIDLGRSSLIHLLDSAEVTQALLRMQRDPSAPVSREVAMELAQRESVKAVLAGKVQPLGPGAVVSVRLVAASSGDTLVAYQATARTFDALPAVVRRLSARLRERIGESIRSIRADSLPG